MFYSNAAWLQRGKNTDVYNHLSIQTNINNLFVVGGKKEIKENTYHLGHEGQQRLPRGRTVYRDVFPERVENAVEFGLAKDFHAASAHDDALHSLQADLVRICPKGQRKAAFDQVLLAVEFPLLGNPK